MPKLQLILAAACAPSGVPLAAQEAAPTGPAASADMAGIAPLRLSDSPARTPWVDPDPRGDWPITHLHFTALQRRSEQGRGHRDITSSRAERALLKQE
jgi:hypothetical protein